MKSIKRYFSIVLAICLLFLSVSGNVKADGQSNEPFPQTNVTTLENNDQVVTTYSEKDGIEAYVTYNKITKDITAKTIEKTHNVLGISMASPNETEYSIDVKTAVDGEITALATDLSTQEQFLIQDSNPDNNVVQAQIALPLIPVIEWLGALILATLATAAVLYINDMEFVNVSDTTVENNVRKDPSAYYYAHVDMSTNSVFIGPKVSYQAALAWVRGLNNIFTLQRNRAYTLAKNATNSEPIEHTNEYYTKGEGYFKHFHPRNVTFAGQKSPNHIWYFN